MHARRIFFATTVTAVMGLALPAYAQTPAPVTGKECTDGGGTVKSEDMGNGRERLSCDGGTHDGAKVEG